MKHLPSPLRALFLFMGLLVLVNTLTCSYGALRGSQEHPRLCVYMDKGTWLRSEELLREDLSKQEHKLEWYRLFIFRNSYLPKGKNLLRPLLLLLALSCLLVRVGITKRVLLTWLSVSIITLTSYSTYKNTRENWYRSNLLRKDPISYWDKRRILKAFLHQRRLLPYRMILVRAKIPGVVKAVGTWQRTAPAGATPWDILLWVITIIVVVPVLYKTFTKWRNWK